MIFFKAEAHSNIGGGHLNRALRLAELCLDEGEEVEFIFSDSEKSAINKVIDNGYQWHHIDPRDQLTPSFYIKIIPKGSLIIFDTDDPDFYSGEFIEILRLNNIKTACFSITDRYEISTDLLINPNIISKVQHYKTKPYTKKLLGPAYMIFDKQFRFIDDCNHKKLNFPLTLILLFGNADNNNLTHYFLNNIDGFAKYLKKIIVVVGHLNNDLNQIKNTLRKKKKILNIELFVDTKNITKLYEKADLAITSAGMAMWEMALLCIPQLVVSSNEREIIYTNYLSDLNYIIKLGDAQKLKSDTHISDRIVQLIEGSKVKNLDTCSFCRIINPKGIHAIVRNFKEVQK